MKRVISHTLKSRAFIFATEPLGEWTGPCAAVRTAFEAGISLERRRARAT